MFNAVNAEGKQMYRYQVNFTKVFVSGLFKGKTYHDYLRFVDWKSADDFAKSCDGKTIVCSLTGSDYFKEDGILSALEPTNTAKELRKAVG